MHESRYRKLLLAGEPAHALAGDAAVGIAPLAPASKDRRSTTTPISIGDDGDWAEVVSVSYRQCCSRDLRFDCLWHHKVVQIARPLVLMTACGSGSHRNSLSWFQLLKNP